MADFEKKGRVKDTPKNTRKYGRIRASELGGCVVTSPEGVDGKLGELKLKEVYKLKPTQANEKCVAKGIKNIFRGVELTEEDLLRLVKSKEIKNTAGNVTIQPEKVANEALKAKGTLTRIADGQNKGFYGGSAKSKEGPVATGEKTEAKIGEGRSNTSQVAKPAQELAPKTKIENKLLTYADSHYVIPSKETLGDTTVNAYKIFKALRDSLPKTEKDYHRTKGTSSLTYEATQLLRAVPIKEFTDFLAANKETLVLRNPDVFKEKGAPSVSGKGDLIIEPLDRIDLSRMLTPGNIKLLLENSEGSGTVVPRIIKEIRPNPNPILSEKKGAGKTAVPMKTLKERFPNAKTQNELRSLVDGAVKQLEQDPFVLKYKEALAPLFPRIRAIMAALIRTESGDPNERDVAGDNTKKSVKEAMGYTQLRTLGAQDAWPPSWGRFDEQAVHDERKNILLGTRYLMQLYVRFKNEDAPILSLDQRKLLPVKYQGSTLPIGIDDPALINALSAFNMGPTKYNKLLADKIPAKLVPILLAAAEDYVQSVSNNLVKFEGQSKIDRSPQVAKR